jgi:Protein of unknown function (DUF3072)
MASPKTELNRYFEMIHRRVPTRVSQFIRWLRQPSSFAARLGVAVLFIIGGIFSFLPVLGIWMLPLGLLLIAQDVHFLQKPLVASLSWTEKQWDRVKLKWQRFRDRRSLTMNNPKAGPTDNAKKDPDEWLSGDDPMTGAQASYLRTPCEQAGTHDKSQDNLTKAEASKLIEEMREKANIK